MTCLTQTLPTYSNITTGFSGIKLPALPTFPKPFFGPVISPTMITPHWTVEVQNSFFSNLSTQILSEICGLLGISYSSLIPSIPNLPGITIADFISGNVAAIEAAIKSAGTAFTSQFQSMTPIYAPAVEMAHMIQATFSSQVKAIVDLIIGQISAVASFIHSLTSGSVTIPIPPIPTFPSPSSITSAINAAMKLGTPTVSFPGFPPVTFPDFGSIHAPSMQAVKAVPMVVADLTIGLLQPVESFVNSISTWMPYTWPKCCVNDGGFYLG